MSDIHILDRTLDNKRVNCVFHIDVPDTNNEVGTNWRDAVQRYLEPEPIMSWNDSTENENVVAGNVLEIAETVRFSSTNLTNAQRLAEVETAYASRTIVLMSELQDKLNFFGREV